MGFSNRVCYEVCQLMLIVLCTWPNIRIVEITNHVVMLASTINLEQEKLAVVVRGNLITVSQFQ